MKAFVTGSREGQEGKSRDVSGWWKLDGEATSKVKDIATGAHYDDNCG